MITFRLRWLLPVAALTALTAARAGDPLADPGQPSPLDAQVRVPAVVYDSAFKSYRAHADDPLQSWPQALETVGRIGGWRAYAREAAPTPTEAPQGSAAAPAAPPAPIGHGADHHH